jgi:hypothetical protein
VTGVQTCALPIYEIGQIAVQIIVRNGIGKTESRTDLWKKGQHVGILDVDHGVIEFKAFLAFKRAAVYGE